MKSNTVLGVVGGALIAVSVFLTGNSITFSGEAIKGTVALILFLAALAIILLSVMLKRTAAGYAAIVAGTIALIELVEMIRNDSVDFSVRLVLLLVGVALALFSTLGRRKA